jgi:hypothetical protein
MIKLLRRLLVLTLLAGLVTGAYVATPFWTAWSIREAIKANDSAYLERKIEWAAVRKTLKASLGKYSLMSGGELAEPPAKPSWWQRTKAYFGQGAIDRFVDTAVTPTGLNGVLTMRKAAFGVEDPAKQPALVDRMRRLWSRVTRAEFVRADRLELEMIDKYEPERTIACALELRGFEWIMTEIAVKPTSKDKAAAVRLQLAVN